MEHLQPITEGNSYKSVSKQIQLLMNKYMCVKKQIQEMIKESEIIIIENTHAYMQAAVMVMFTHMHAKKGTKLFGERAIVAMIKSLI